MMENQISGLTKDREAAKVSAAEASAEQRVIKSDLKISRYLPCNKVTESVCVCVYRSTHYPLYRYGSPLQGSFSYLNFTPFPLSNPCR